ncbi:F0F1 ATP synthase subunit gamma [Proteiniclasticum sp. SCR006]|uniref:F0F1 ATP synthase subunit gamma n=1 Tax=Proteiniclasticum aestuarii TaxID=2817862 RepID=A0A939HCP2_9CLOT|nr:FoF1 ATP synthase subunit gamma [Proteiniclasticum aestuarii]MBO1265552.1 F0F1 ATP synthase subunit gamma [Proteiniclasticum aestuarii]
MKNLQSLKKSLTSTRNLYTIVNTMKLHATTNINQFQQAADASMQYRQVLNKALTVVMKKREMPEEVLRRSEGKTIHVVFSSDHGLCGSFNERITDYARTRIPKDEKNLLLIIGEQGLRRLEEYEVEEFFSVPQSVDGITSSVQYLLSELDELRETEKVKEIYLHYNRSTGRQGFKEHSEKLFPLDLKKIRKEDVKWKSGAQPTYYMSGERLLSDLLKQYYFITLFRTFCYSLVTENESRIASMTSAKKNIEERMEDLEMRYKRLRQDSITEEIRDITSGFHVLKKKE